MTGSITLGAVAARVTILEIACGRCERRGKVHVAKLIEQYGTEAELPALRGALAGDCPRRASVSYNDRCDVFFPQLPALF